MPTGVFLQAEGGLQQDGQSYAGAAPKRCHLLLCRQPRSRSCTCSHEAGTTLFCCATFAATAVYTLRNAISVQQFVYASRTAHTYGYKSGDSLTHLHPVYHL